MTFDRLRGINAGRAPIEPTERSVLEKLLDVGRNFVETKGLGKRFDITQYEKQRDKIEQALEGVDFTDKDLEQFVFANANRDDDVRLVKARGVITAALLDILNIRRKRAGERCVVRINGRGLRFDNLFNNAQNIDELYLDGFTGNRICKNLGYNGNINRAVFTNIKGDELATGIASHQAYAGEVVLIGCEGSHMASGAGTYTSNIHMLLLAGNRGTSAAKDAYGFHGAGNVFLIANHNGMNAGYHLVSSSGNLKMALFADNDSNGMARSCGSTGGTIELLVMSGNRGSGHAEHIANSGYVNLVYASDCNGSIMEAAAGRMGIVNVAIVENNPGFNLSEYMVNAGNSHALLLHSLSMAFPGKLSVNRGGPRKIYITDKCNTELVSRDGELIKGAEALEAYHRVMGMYRLAQIKSEIWRMGDVTPEELIAKGVRLWDTYIDIQPMLEANKESRPKVE